MFLLKKNIASSVYPLSEDTEEKFLLFIAHCFKNLCLRYSTIKLYMCGILFMYLKAGKPCLLLGGGSTCVHIYTLLNAIKRIQGQSKRPRHPLSGAILRQMCGILKAGYTAEYTDCLLQAVCATALFGFLRCEELTTEQQNFHPHSNLCLSDLTFSDGHVDLFLKSSKTDPFRQGINTPLF